MIRRLMCEVVNYLRSPIAVPKETAGLIGDELQFHLEESIREGVDSGLSEYEARQQALARFGSVNTAFRDCACGAAEGHVRCHRAHLAITACLLFAVGALGAWLSMRPSNDAVELLLTGDISGRVLDENSVPIEGAHVLAVVKTWPEDGFQQKAHTGVTRPDGTFLLADVYPEHDDYEVQIAVLANGRVMESSYFSRQTGRLPSAEFQLDPSSPLAVRFESDDGVPVRGIEVFPFQRVAASGAEDTVYFCSAKPITRRSSASGEVSLPYFAPGDTATVYARSPGGEWITHDFAVAAPEQVVVIKLRQLPAEGELASASTSSEREDVP
jgi:hypothetical protein